jgi:hypothetical protein
MLNLRDSSQKDHMVRLEPGWIIENDGELGQERWHGLGMDRPDEDEIQTSTAAELVAGNKTEKAERKPELGQCKGIG